MNDPIQWGRSELTWSPEGYRLKLSVWLDVRASALFERGLPAVLDGFAELFDDGKLTWEFEGGHRWANETGAGSEPGSLVLLAPRTIFAIDPERLRAALRDLAVSARKEADEQQARDQEIAEAWLKDLRSAPTTTPSE